MTAPTEHLILIEARKGKMTAGDIHRRFFLFFSRHTILHTLFRATFLSFRMQIVILRSLHHITKMRVKRTLDHAAYKNQIWYQVIFLDEKSIT